MPVMYAPMNRIILVILCLRHISVTQGGVDRNQVNQACATFKHQATNFFLTGVEGSMHHGIANLLPKLHEVSFQTSTDKDDPCCHVEWTSYPSKVKTL